MTLDPTLGATVVETLLYRAPLAIAATDGATGEPVADAIAATVWPTDGSGWSRTARRSVFSSLLGFGHLPGLSRQEQVAGPGSALPPWPPAGTQPIVVGLTDAQRRFLPQAVAVTVPYANPGPMPLAVTLHSAVSRSRPPGYAMVSGEVRLASGGPAPWAVVVLATPGVPDRTTVCDETGRFVHYLQYPDALPALSGSPPSGGGLGGVTWPLTLTVRSKPGTLQQPAVPVAFPVPLIGSVLGQPVAPVTGGGAVTLVFGVPLRVQLTVTPP